MKLVPAAVGAVFAAILFVSAPVRAQPVDLQLVLAIDSSSSVTMDEYYLQLQGYAAAFRHPDLLKAIQSGPEKAIAVMLFEWSSQGVHQIDFDWRRIDSAESLATFATELEIAPRLVIGGETAIGDAIDFAMGQFNPPGFGGGRRVIDVSGDGANNRGRPAAAARDDAVFQGVTINGLAVLHEEPHLDQFYRENVVGGPGAFVIAAHDYQDFGDAILKKLVHEIQNVAQATP